MNKPKEGRLGDEKKESREGDRRKEGRVGRWEVGGLGWGMRMRAG